MVGSFLHLFLTPFVKSGTVLFFLLFFLPPPPFRTNPPTRRPATQ